MVAVCASSNSQCGQFADRDLIVWNDAMWPTIGQRRSHPRRIGTY